MHSFPRLFSTLFLLAILVIAFFGTSTSASPTGVTRPVRPVRPLKHVTRAMLVEQATRTKAKRQTRASATPFPASDGGYVSTGTVPWAVFTNLDIDCRSNTFQSGRFPTQESCNQLCQGQSGKSAVACRYRWSDLTDVNVVSHRLYRHDLASP